VDELVGILLYIRNRAGASAGNAKGFYGLSAGSTRKRRGSMAPDYWQPKACKFRFVPLRRAAPSSRSVEQQTPLIAALRHAVPRRYKSEESVQRWRSLFEPPATTTSRLQNYRELSLARC